MLIAEALAGAHKLQQVREPSLELLRISRLGGCGDLGVELFERRQLVLGQLVLALGGDPYDHAPAAFSPGSVSCGAAAPEASSAFIFASSESTSLSLVTWSSCRETSSSPASSCMGSSSVPACSSSPTASARAFISSV